MSCWDTARLPWSCHHLVLTAMLPLPSGRSVVSISQVETLSPRETGLPEWPRCGAAQLPAEPVLFPSSQATAVSDGLVTRTEIPRVFRSHPTGSLVSLTFTQRRGLFTSVAPADYAHWLVLCVCVCVALNASDFHQLDLGFQFLLLFRVGCY